MDQDINGRRSRKIDHLAFERRAFGIRLDLETGRRLDTDLLGGPEETLDPGRGVMVNDPDRLKAREPGAVNDLFGVERAVRIFAVNMVVAFERKRRAADPAGPGAARRASGELSHDLQRSRAGEKRHV